MIAVYPIQSGNKGNRKNKQEKENVKLRNAIDIMISNYRVATNILD